MSENADVRAARAKALNALRGRLRSVDDEITVAKNALSIALLDLVATTDDPALASGVAHVSRVVSRGVTLDDVGGPKFVDETLKSIPHHLGVAFWDLEKQRCARRSLASAITSLEAAS